MNRIYLDTARLLTQVAPLVFADGIFALKGGTAINLFIRDMPRLSVDLDLVFPDYRLPRDQALSRINETIRLAAERLTVRGFQTVTRATPEAGETKLLVRRGGIEVKGRGQLRDARNRTSERRFLLSLVGNKPEWHLLELEHLDQLPGIRWKLRNLEQLERSSPKKFAEQANSLVRLLL